MDGKPLVEMLIGMFPRKVVEGPTAPHDCPRCLGLREKLRGITWLDVPEGFVRSHSDVLPLLSPEAYLAFLPAWLRQGILEPNGDVAGMLLVNLECHSDTAGFTVEQRKTIIDAARFIVQNDGWGPEDRENLKSLVAIERAWASPAQPDARPSLSQPAVGVATVKDERGFLGSSD